MFLSPVQTKGISQIGRAALVLTARWCYFEYLMDDGMNSPDAVPADSSQTAKELLPLVYEELRRLAAARMANEAGTQTLQPTALVHEAWLRLNAPSPGQWQNRGHFFAAAAEAMRRILIDRARRRARLKHGAGKAHLDVSAIELADTAPDERLLAVNEALEQLERADPAKARVVSLKFFGGLTNAEVAETLGITERSIERQWAFAKVWLLRAMRSDS
jgi:RNA polymerase sigma factor (TIGR02999 family)